MKSISILNDVIGPVMRGPSSSHTAGSYHLSALARSLLGDVPVEAEFTFDPGGSYAQCYQTQGSDLAFTAGLLGWSITDDRFPQALELAPTEGLQVRFLIKTIPDAGHPNTVHVRLRGRSGRTLQVVGQSVGGGAVEMVAVEGWPVRLTGCCHETLIEVSAAAESGARQLLEADGDNLAAIQRQERGPRVLLFAQRRKALADGLVDKLAMLPGRPRLFQGAPMSFVKQGPQLFDSAQGMVALAEAEKLSPGQVAARYEAALLGLSERAVIEEIMRRVDIMVAAVRRGLGQDAPNMQLLRPTARNIYQAEAAGKLAMGGLHTRAAVRAMAAMHVNCGKGVVCAAPTAGSAGVIPGVLTTLLEEKNVSRDSLALALLAAGAVGVIIAERATFAAEVAGCQVEIGAAGAMAAAAVVQVAGGAMGQACDAAAIAFQNTMGSVCDLVQGIVEIPCHTRNAVAASAAFVNADLILGSYHNPIPLDETIDAVYAVGLAMPAELRVTSLGGLAVTPSAKALPRLCSNCDSHSV
ncbi:MAG: L-serine ammonia-lyase, iron-sulfur-dependent, subunit alpha [Verrucomicrobia bacterium]|nr:L-serine ammonia-lyase, iron-sulfur-dependent, subunit alpha [Verrucomicrobiota bacterium]